MVYGPHSKSHSSHSETCRRLTRQSPRHVENSLDSLLADLRAAIHTLRNVTLHLIAFKRSMPRSSSMINGHPRVAHRGVFMPLRASLCSSSLTSSKCSSFSPLQELCAVGRYSTCALGTSHPGARARLPDVLVDLDPALVVDVDDRLLTHSCRCPSSRASGPPRGAAGTSPTRAGSGTPHSFEMLCLAALLLGVLVLARWDRRRCRAGAVTADPFSTSTPSLSHFCSTRSLTCLAHSPNISAHSAIYSSFSADCVAPSMNFVAPSSRCVSKLLTGFLARLSPSTLRPSRSSASMEEVLTLVVSSSTGSPPPSLRPSFPASHSCRTSHSGASPLRPTSSPKLPLDDDTGLLSPHHCASALRGARCTSVTQSQATACTLLPEALPVLRVALAALRLVLAVPVEPTARHISAGARRPAPLCAPTTGGRSVHDARHRFELTLLVVLTLAEPHLHVLVELLLELDAGPLDLVLQLVLAELRSIVTLLHRVRAARFSALRASLAASGASRSGTSAAQLLFSSLSLSHSMHTMNYSFHIAGVSHSSLSARVPAGSSPGPRASRARPSGSAEPLRVIQPCAGPSCPAP
eukprot:CAMPEP_0177559908 /NCGR_PEP_ID=MMETSP0369-20130122/71096_1 /TAXON_ID=447022 ORGANISM="Scrippsiella hangoei-like, Strain SHHI-4" /NCGR_SAMPLE_ID=MMETSP0369 /ASSEMBLY_ACC=CAM_ASM_000364 /LENGTH=579 /DNA_ID=CAMNT_0019046687 /DNA_START=93 /DNA_END=1831 /DNA_ORIENTATION=-